MSFNSWIRGLFGGDPPKSAGGMLSGLFPSGVPPKRGTRELLRAYSSVPWLRSIVHRISNDVANVPFELLAPAPGRKSRHMHHARRQIRAARGKVRRDLVSGYLGAGDLVPLEEHPLLSLFETMNPALRRWGSLFVGQAYQEVKGETFWIKERAIDGTVLELWPVPPSWCRATATPGDPFFHFSIGSWQRSITEEDVLWQRSPQLENPYSRGVGIAEALADEFDIDEFAAKHVKSWFFNRAMPDVFVSMEGIDSEEEAIRFESRLRAKHQGVGKGFQIHVGNGKTQVQEVGQSFKEQQLVELRRNERDVFLQIWNIPPEIVGVIENSNRATIDASYYLYAMGVLCPRLDQAADTFQQLVDETGEPLVVDYVSPVPEDRTFKKEVMIAVPGLFTKNEIRALAGMPPREGWDDELAERPAPVFPPMGPPSPTDDEAPPEPEPDLDPEEDDDPDALKSGARRSLRAVP